MPTNNLISLEGFNQTIDSLKKMGAEVNKKVIRKAMTEGPVSLIASAKENAKRMKSKNRKEGRHLYQSIGKRVKVYNKNGFTFVAVGGLYRQGGYHAHLLEFGHRIANFGTLKRLNNRPATKSKGRGLTGMGKALTRKSGSNKVPEYPFLKPAWDSTKQRVLYAITDSIKQNLVDQCVAVAKVSGAVK